MEPSVQHYFRKGLAPSTQKTYSGALKCFYLFCTRYTVINPYPLSEHLLCSFAAHLADQGLSPQSIKTYLSAVRSVQISLGFPDLRDRSSLPYLKRVQAGISRCRGQKGSPTKQRLPVTAEVLRRVQRVLTSPDRKERTVVWAIAVTAFFGFFRLGELLPDTCSTFDPKTDLAWGDLAVDSHTDTRTAKIHLKKSKCDQFGKGVDVYLGRTDLDLCPVTALLAYIETRGSGPGPLFVDSSQARITNPWFIGQFRDVLATAGLPQQEYAGHSFRIGAATTAASVGLEDSTIQLLGRWQNAAFLRYVRTPGTQLATLSASLVRRERQPPPSNK